MSGQNDPRITGGGGDLGRAMLRAAAIEEPAAGAAERTLAAMGVGVGTAGTAAAAAGTSVLIKWGVGIGVCALAAAGVWSTSRSRAAPPTCVVAVASAPQSAPPALPAPTPEGAEPVLPAAPPSTARPSPPAARTRTPPKETVPPGLAEEVAAIDAAQAALDRGDAAGCLGELDTYRRRFPRGALGQEAAVMRVEALLRSGDRKDARSLADRLLAAGAGPYTERIRSLRNAASNP